MQIPHIYPVTIYYEDTDITGYVYHPNYLKYFERARSDFFDGEKLRRMQFEDKISVVVYKVEAIFKKGAVLGDKIEIHSTAKVEGNYKVVVNQQAVRVKDSTLLVDGTVELVCISDARLISLPGWIGQKIQ